MTLSTSFLSPVTYAVPFRLICAIDGLYAIVKTNGTSSEPSDCLLTLTRLMLVLIWICGIGFLISKNRSAEMLAIATLTLIILNQPRKYHAQVGFKIVYFACLYRVKPQWPHVYLSLWSPIKKPVPHRSQVGRSLATFSPSILYKA